MSSDASGKAVASSAGVGLAVSAVVMYWMPLRSTESMLFVLSIYLLVAGAVSATVLWNVRTWQRVSAYRAEFRNPGLHRFGVQGVGLALGASLAAFNAGRAATIASSHTAAAATLLFLALFAAVAPIALWVGLAVGARLDGWFGNDLPDED